MRATSCIARAQPANVFRGPFSRCHSERAESGYGGRRPLADEAASENMDYRKQLRLRLPDIRGRPRRLAVQDDVGRHKSVDVLRGYVRDADAFRDHAGMGLL
jgi:hypothetical protein